MAHEYPHLPVLPVRESRDDWRKLRGDDRASSWPNIPISSASTMWAAARAASSSALEAAGRARDIVFIAHEITDTSRRALIRGTIDAIINQDAGHEVRSAVRVLMAKADKLPLIESQERIRIDIFMRDNLP